MQHARTNAPRELIRKVLLHQKVRFILVGISNTAIDIILFNVGTQLLHLDIVWANIISTTIAMGVSYLFNKHAVFKDGAHHSMRQVAIFLVVTLTGIWLIQTIAMVQVYQLLQAEFIVNGHPTLVWLLQNIAKVAGVVVGALWNYIGYSRFVFGKRSS